MWFGEVWQGGDWVGERNAPGMAWYGGARFGSAWRGKARQGAARLGQYRERQAFFACRSLYAKLKAQVSDYQPGSMRSLWYRPGHARLAPHRQAPRCMSFPAGRSCLLLSFSGLGKIFAAGGRVVGMLRHSRPVVTIPRPRPENLLTSTGSCRRTEETAPHCRLCRSRRPSVSSPYHRQHTMT